MRRRTAKDLQMRCLAQERNCDFCNAGPLLRFCPSLRILRSFSVLRRLSLATLAQRLRQLQDDIAFLALLPIHSSTAPSAQAIGQTRSDSRIWSGFFATPRRSLMRPMIGPPNP